MRHLSGRFFPTDYTVTPSPGEAKSLDSKVRSIAGRLPARMSHRVPDPLLSTTRLFSEIKSQTIFSVGISKGIAPFPTARDKVATNNI